jgi:predicted HicB family RNase H-like nuclease
MNPEFVIEAEISENDLPPRRFKPKVFTIRMSEESLAWLQEVAARKEVSPSTLARMWILERLSQEGTPSGNEWV